MNWRSTKFVTTCFVLCASFVGLMYGVLDATSYVGVTALALGNYAHHDVKQKGL
jgi:hypothetical protein